MLVENKPGISNSLCTVGPTLIFKRLILQISNFHALPSIFEETDFFWAVKNKFRNYEILWRSSVMSSIQKFPFFSVEETNFPLRWPRSKASHDFLFSYLPLFRNHKDHRNPILLPKQSPSNEQIPWGYRAFQHIRATGVVFFFNTCALLGRY